MLHFRYPLFDNIVNFAKKKIDMEKRYENLVSRLAGQSCVKVLFVCLGNICRSPAAEGVMRRIVEEGGEGSRWVIDSALDVTT